MKKVVLTSVAIAGGALLWLASPVFAGGLPPCDSYEFTDMCGSPYANGT